MAVDPASESVDPQAPQSWNRYIYALDNPIKYIDPNGEMSYLCGRPLENKPRNIAQHMFVASNALLPGDPNATLYSYGKTDSGNMGRVDNSTTNDQSKGTAQTDADVWASAGQPGSTLTCVEIPATDAAVDASASAVMEDQPYSKAGDGVTGINSNSAAQAVANDASGTTVGKPGWRAAPGTGAAGQVNFDKDGDCQPDPKPPKPVDIKH